MPLLRTFFGGVRAPRAGASSDCTMYEYAMPRGTSADSATVTSSPPCSARLSFLCNGLPLTLSARPPTLHCSMTAGEPPPGGGGAGLRVHSSTALRDDVTAEMPSK